MEYTRRIGREMTNTVQELENNFYGLPFPKFIEGIGGKLLTKKTIGGVGYYFFHMSEENASLFYGINHSTGTTRPFDSVFRVEVVLGGSEAASEIERRILEAEEAHASKSSKQHLSIE